MINNTSYCQITQVHQINKMEYFSKKYRVLTSLFSSQIKVESPHKVRRNIHLENVYKVLSWNDPFVSWGSFIIINFLFWLTLQLKLRLLGMMFSIVLMLFLYDNLFCNVGSSASDHHFTDDIEQFGVINSVFSTMCMLRKENPSVFCLVMSVFFLILSFVARSMSGMLLTYLVILGIFFFPLGYKNLPVQVKRGIQETIKSALTSQGVIDEDDLIPLQVPHKVDGNEVDLESLDTDRTAESVTNSLISGISSMPSFMDAEDNNEILEEDLMPLTALKNREMTPGLADLSSDSDSELREMRFKESHFSKDTSSDEGSKFEEGLQFSEETTDSASTAIQYGANRLVQGFVDYVAAASAKSLLLPNLINTFTTAEQSSETTRKSSSSESDFEVVDPEDVKQ